MGSPPTNTIQAAPSVPVSMTTINQQLATYFQSLDTTGTGTLPSDFDADIYMEQMTQRLEGIYAQYSTEGYAQSGTHTPGAVSPVFDVDGMAAACMEMNSQEVKSATSKSGPVVQPPDRSQWGQQVAPGSYSSITESDFNINCFVETTAGTVWLITSWGGASARSGTPN